MSDWPSLYRDHVEAVGALALGLDDDLLATAVPATPAWTVHDLLAHLAGGPADAVSDRMEGAPGPEWTARHVAARAQLPVAELVAEMQANTDAIAASVADNPRPAIVWDIAVHHADLHEALGRPMLGARYWQPVVHAVAPMLLSQVPATVVCGEATYGAGGPRLEVPPYELFRAAFSRRSRRQMAEWGGSLGAEVLDGLCIFGPRDDDQPQPLAEPTG